MALIKCNMPKIMDDFPMDSKQKKKSGMVPWILICLTGFRLGVKAKSICKFFKRNGTLVQFCKNIFFCFFGMFWKRNLRNLTIPKILTNKGFWTKFYLISYYKREGFGTKLQTQLINKNPFHGPHQSFTSQVL